MSIYNPDQLFHPRSVAIVGATDKYGSVGSVVLQNILQGGAGRIHLGNLGSLLAQNTYMLAFQLERRCESGDYILSLDLPKRLNAVFRPPAVTG